MKATAWSYKYWTVTCPEPWLDPWVLASYPYVNTRAWGICDGNKSLSQRVPSLAVHVFSRCPFSPCTATILGTVRRKEQAKIKPQNRLLHTSVVSMGKDFESQSLAAAVDWRFQRWSQTLLSRGWYRDLKVVEQVRQHKRRQDLDPRFVGRFLCRRYGFLKPRSLFRACSSTPRENSLHILKLL